MSTNATVAAIADKSALGPLSAEHHGELALARDRAKKIRSAAAVAAFNGWATALVAVLSAPFALFGASGLAVTAALAIVAWNEFRGRKRLLRFDPSAAAMLGCNQLALLALIIAYCLWAVSSNLREADVLTAELHGFASADPALGSLGGVDTLVKQLVVLIYGVVILLSVVFQGLNSVYYFTRRKHIDRYIAETPQWIRDLQQ
jgi:hypothetical protein